MARTFGAARSALAADAGSSPMFGRSFGIATDIQTGPRGDLFVVSLSRGVVYQIYRKHS